MYGLDSIMKAKGMHIAHLNVWSITDRVNDFLQSDVCCETWRCLLLDQK